MLSGEFPKLFQVKKIGAVENIANPLVVTNSYKFTSLCVVDMMIICSIYFHSYGYMRLATCPISVQLRKSDFHSCPSSPVVRVTNRSPIVCLLATPYTCAYNLYISPYIYIYEYLDLPM